MHLHFQKEENVCTKTCDRIDPVIITVFKADTKLPWEKQPITGCNHSTLASPPTHPITSPPPHPLVSFSFHLFNDPSKHLVHSRLSGSLTL